MHIRRLLRSLVATAAILAFGPSVTSGVGWGGPPGWETKAAPEWAMVEASSCPVKRVKAATLQKLPSIPTIITDVAEGWSVFKAWQDKTRFLEEFGHLSIRHSPISGPIQFLMESANRTTEKLRDFAEKLDRSQAFDVELADDPDPDLSEDVGSDPAVRRVREAAGTWKLPRSRWKFSPQDTLSLGGHGQGLPFHVHGASWLALITGMKVWFMYPPEMPEEAVETLGIASIAKWAEKDYIKSLPKQYMQPGGGLKGRPMRCLQQPGEIMFLPAYWWHATYNLGEALAVGSQSKHFPEQAAMAEKKYPDSSAILHMMMLHATSGPTSDHAAKEALEWGKKAMHFSPYNPKIAMDYALLLRGRGDEAGCQAILNEYLAKIDKLHNQDMVSASEAKSIKQQLRDALGSLQDGGDEEGTARAPHDEF